MDKRKVLGVARWIISYVICIACFVYSFPYVLFLTYPYCIIYFSSLILSILVFSFLSVFKPLIKNKKIVRGILQGLLAVPVVTTILLEISFAMGWIHIC